jgi:ferrous iron transport protein B
MEKKRIRVALAGNPNVGKTTIFNALTGEKQRVGNFPGVTVEKKSGKRVYQGFHIEFVDLPGTYSLTAYSLDEIVARDFIIDAKPDVVVQVMDATNIERNMYLTTQLMELGVRIVMALNMSDLADARGDTFDTRKMEKFLEIPVVKTVGCDGSGIEQLLDEIINESTKGPHHEHEISYGMEIDRKIIELMKILEQDPEIQKKLYLRWLSIKLLEGDKDALKKLRASSVYKQVKKMLDKIEKEEYELIMADKRYEAISAVLPQVCTISKEKFSISDMIDKVFTNKYLGIPIFLALMWGAFELTFTFSKPFMDLIDMGFARLGEFVITNVEPAWLASLIGDGIIGSVGFVLVFVPVIFILFLLLSFLEESGYLARAAFIMDRLMYKIGLPGKSFIPMLMGFGCNVPAIMATRTIEDKKDRLTTILVNPFISCGARLPVYVLLAGVFFGRQAGAVIFSMYVIGIAAAIFSAKLFRSTVVKGKPAPFIMELPPYRFPTLKNSSMQMWERGKSYIRKAGTIILLGAIIIWFLASFPSGVEYGSENSYAGIIGKAIAPLLAPLGFDWRITIALIFGFVAKEIVIGSLGVIYGAGGDEEALTDKLQAENSGIYPLNAFGLMVFTLLYTPCIATTAVIKQETGSWKWTAFSIVYSVSLAWIVVFIIFQVGRLAGFGT